MSFSPVTGDPIVCRSASNKRKLISGSVITSSCGRVGGLRVFVPSWLRRFALTPLKATESSLLAGDVLYDGQSKPHTVFALCIQGREDLLM